MTKKAAAQIVQPVQTRMTPDIPGRYSNDLQVVSIIEIQDSLPAAQNDMSDTACARGAGKR
jgi:hypothetical protein